MIMIVLAELQSNVTNLLLFMSRRETTGTVDRRLVR